MVARSGAPLPGQRKGHGGRARHPAPVGSASRGESEGADHLVELPRVVAVGDRRDPPRSAPPGHPAGPRTSRRAMRRAALSEGCRTGRRGPAARAGARHPFAPASARCLPRRRYRCRAQLRRLPPAGAAAGAGPRSARRPRTRLGRRRVGTVSTGAGGAGSTGCGLGAGGGRHRHRLGLGPRRRGHAGRGRRGEGRVIYATRLPPPPPPPMAKSDGAPGAAVRRQSRSPRVSITPSSPACSSTETTSPPARRRAWGICRLGGWSGARVEASWLRDRTGER